MSLDTRGRSSRRCRKGSDGGAWPSSTEPANLVWDDWAPKALELDLTDRCRVDDILDLGQHTLTDQCLSDRRVSAEPRREVRDRPDCSIVVAAFEADSTERRIAGRDPAEPEL